jgi:hypothetical protein
LQAVIASYGAVCCDDKELLIIGPAEAFDGSFIPFDAPEEFARTAIDVYTRLGRLCGLISNDLAVVPVECCLLVSMIVLREVYHVDAYTPVGITSTTSSDLYV